MIFWIILNYTMPAQEITLTAAKDRTPSGSTALISDSIDNIPLFIDNILLFLILDNILSVCYNKIKSTDRIPFAFYPQNLHHGTERMKQPYSNSSSFPFRRAAFAFLHRIFISKNRKGALCI